MTTILAAAAAAFSAVYAYNKAMAANPTKTAGTVRNIRQGVAVVTAVADAFWSIIDALQNLTRRSSVSATTASPLRRLGTTPASD